MRRVKNIIRNIGGYVYYNAIKKFQDYGNRCLIYHAFGSKLKHDTYGISIDINKFESHIKYLNDNYKIININNFRSNELTVSISIDDGYKDTIDAINILNKYNTPFALFMTTGSMNEDTFLSSNDIREISQLKQSMIGTHGLSHCKLADLNYQKQYDELINSKRELESIIERKIDITSYPHGSYNVDTLNILSRLEYKWAACSKKGFNSIKTNNYLLQRSEIIASDDVRDLEYKIKGYYDYY